jgi:hypothetical protein
VLYHVSAEDQIWLVWKGFVDEVLLLEVHVGSILILHLVALNQSCIEAAGSSRPSHSIERAEMSDHAVVAARKEWKPDRTESQYIMSKTAHCLLLSLTVSVAASRCYRQGCDDTSQAMAPHITELSLWEMNSEQQHSLLRASLAHHSLPSDCRAGIE